MKSPVSFTGDTNAASAASLPGYQIVGHEISQEGPRPFKADSFFKVDDRMSISRRQDRCGADAFESINSWLERVLDVGLVPSLGL